MTFNLDEIRALCEECMLWEPKDWTRSACLKCSDQAVALARNFDPLIAEIERLTKSLEIERDVRIAEFERLRRQTTTAETATVAAIVTYCERAIPGSMPDADFEAFLIGLESGAWKRGVE